MLNKAYSILHDNMLAEDAVSEAFIRIYRHIGRIGDPDSGRSAAFIYTIVRNTALTILSKEGRGSVVDTEEDQADGFELEEHVLSRISSERIYELLSGVSDELRSVFLLKFAYDLPHRQIADMLGITENNVTVRLHRAKKKIAEILTKEGYVRER